MLYFSLISTTLLLLIVNWIARREANQGVKIVCLSLACLVGPSFLMLALPALVIQSLLLCVVAFAWSMGRGGASAFLKLSCGATLIAYGFSGFLVLQSEREYARLRALYPMESLEGRLPAPRAIVGVARPPVSGARLSRLEDEGDKKSNGYRVYQLRSLHDGAVSLFVNSPGFGIARMVNPTEYGLAANLDDRPVPLQPGTRLDSIWSPGEPSRLAPGEEDSLGWMLDASVRDFANSKGFGYFEDRRHVAGFETHRSHEVPAPAGRWRVQTLELVGLLLHDEPAVYVSSHLPRMDRLHGMPTRPLDRFEKFGLGELRRGEDLVTAPAEDGARLIGAIRNARQCVPCHEGQRGDLLGAFSYSLRTDVP